MATIVKEEVPTEVGRRIPGVPRRLLSWWMLAVVVALVIGLVAGAAGWQATRGTPAAQSTGNSTAATKALAQRYVAQPTWSPAQAAMFAPNGVWIDVPNLDIRRGHTGPRSIDTAFRASQLPGMSAYEKLVYTGPGVFVTDWYLWAPKGPSGQTPFDLFGFSVSQVKNGMITSQRVYYHGKV